MADQRHRIEKGFVSIRKGVPCRNKVWKHFVVDAPQSHFVYHHWESQATPGTEISLCNKSPVQYSKPFCGERGDSFLVSLRLLHQLQDTEKPMVRRTGYNELSYALWPSQPTKPCTHVSKDSNKIILPPSCVAVSGFGDHGGVSLNTKVHICLTAGNKASRWRALLAIAACSDDKNSYMAVLLKGLDCCLRCAVDQALAVPGKCFLVL